MTTAHPPSTGRPAGRRLYGMLTPFPAVCFIAAFVTDLAYWHTALGQWETFSIWLLTGGLIAALFAAIVGLIDYFASERQRGLQPAWAPLIGDAAATLLSLLNAFVHSRDGYTAVLPTGLILSGVVVLILLVTGWAGWTRAYRGVAA
jgi:uncharacterized membrane protein